MAEDKKPTSAKDDSKDKPKGLFPDFNSVDADGKSKDLNDTSVPTPVEAPKEVPKPKIPRLTSIPKVEGPVKPAPAPSGDAVTSYRPAQKAPVAPAEPAAPAADKLVELSEERVAEEDALTKMFGDTTPPTKAPGATDKGAGIPRKVTTLENFFGSEGEEDAPEEAPAQPEAKPTKAAAPKNIFEQAEEAGTKPAVPYSPKPAAPAQADAAAPAADKPAVPYSPKPAVPAPTPAAPAQADAAAPVKGVEAEDDAGHDLEAHVEEEVMPEVDEPIEAGDGEVDDDGTDEIIEEEVGLGIDEEGRDLEDEDDGFISRGIYLARNEEGDATGGHFYHDAGKKETFFLERDADGQIEKAYFVSEDGRRIEVQNLQDFMEALACDDSSSLLEILLQQEARAAAPRSSKPKIYTEDDMAQMEDRYDKRASRAATSNFLIAGIGGVLVGGLVGLIIGTSTGRESFDDEIAVNYVMDSAGNLQRAPATRDYKKVKLLIPADVKDPRAFVQGAYTLARSLLDRTKELEEQVSNYEAGKKSLIAENTSQKEMLKQRYEQLQAAQAALERITAECDEAITEKDKEVAERISILRAELDDTTERLVGISRRLSGSTTLGAYFTSGIGMTDVQRFFMPEVRDWILSYLPEGTEDYRVFQTQDELKIVTSSGEVVPVPMPGEFETGLNRAKSYFENMSTDMDKALARQEGKIRIKYSGGDIFADIYESVYGKKPENIQEILDMRRVVSERASAEKIDTLRYKLKVGQTVGISMKK